MEMDEAQTVVEAHLVDLVEGGEQLGTGKTELGGIATTLRPFAGARGGEFDADADVGLHVELLRHLGDDVEFVELFHHDEDALAHLLGE